QHERPHWPRLSASAQDRRPVAMVGAHRGCRAAETVAHGVGHIRRDAVIARCRQGTRHASRYADYPRRRTTHPSVLTFQPFKAPDCTSVRGFSVFFCITVRSYYVTFSV